MFIVPVLIELFNENKLKFIYIYIYRIYILETAMAHHSRTLVWKIPWMEEPSRLRSMGSLRVGHNWATSLSLFTFMHRRRKWKPLQCSFLENPRDGGAWWAAIYGVAQIWTWLKWLSSSSSMIPLSFILLIWVWVYTPFLCFLSREDPLAFVEELVWWCWILWAFACL